MVGREGGRMDDMIRCLDSRVLMVSIETWRKGGLGSGKRPGNVVGLELS